MIDLHCHVLAAVDDGPATMEDSVALARAAAAAGTTTIVATPHVSWEYPNSAYKVARAVAQLNRRLRETGPALKVLRGAEIAMTRVGSISPSELSQLALGHGQWLLVEPPFSMAGEGLEAVIGKLHEHGYHVLLAHPERCPAFHRDRAMLERLVEAGVLTSLTAASLDGHFGGVVQRFSLELVRDGLVHNVASDAHDQVKRPPSISAELERAGLASLASWLTQAVPAAILGGGDIPPRPVIADPVIAARGDRGPWRRRWPRGRG